MWAQLIKARVKPGREDEIRQLQEGLEARSRTGDTGWLRSINLQGQDDPQVYYSLVFFESEQKARQNESTAEQQELVRRLQDCFEGRPEFVNLNPVQEYNR